MMCCGGFGSRRRSAPNRMQRHEQFRTSRNSFFREEQTDLLNVFQRHQFDLLEANPPSHNPDFVGIPPSYNPDFVPNTRSLFDEASFSALDSTQGHHRRQSSNNPFEDDEVAMRAISMPAIPVAAAVAISDNGEEDFEIPFVSALPIHDHDDGPMDASEPPTTVEPMPVPVPVPVQEQFPGPATRAARPQAQFPQWRQEQRQQQAPPHQQHSNEIPPWLVLNTHKPNMVSAHSRCGNKQRRWGCKRTSWSRISVRARAAAGEAKRNFHNVGRETMPCGWR